MEAPTLPPELERFAAEAVASGRYRDMSEVVLAALTLLRDAETEVAEFLATLRDAVAEGEREGFLAADDVHLEMTEYIEQIRRQRG